MITLAIKIEPEGPLLVLTDSDLGIVETFRFKEPFLKGMVVDAEFRMEHRRLAADP